MATATAPAEDAVAGYAPHEHRPLAAYAGLTAAFGATLGGALVALRAAGRELPESLSPGDLALAGIATHKVSRLLAKDKVTSFIRAPFTRYQESAGHGELEEAPRGSGAQYAIGALLSDCRTAALVTRAGAVDWWPSPRFDSPSAFSALLDDGAGHWTVRPMGRFDATRRYLPGTLVLETTMRAGGGTLRLSDALAFAPGARGHEIGQQAPHALVRVAEALGGDVDVELDCMPRLEYGLAVPRLVEADG